MREPSIVGALKAGYDDPDVYYRRLHSCGDGRPLFYDLCLKAWVVTGYDACREAYRQPTLFGRARLQFAPGFLDGCEDRRVREGARLLAEMSVFSNVNARYAVRRQRLLALLEPGWAAFRRGAIGARAAEHVAALSAGVPVDLFQRSLRPFAAECAGLALTGCLPAPHATADALRLAYFFDGKRISRPHVLDALDAVARLGDWVHEALGADPAAEPELVADLVLCFVAAHESMAFLLHTALAQLARGVQAPRRLLQDADLFERFLREALRYDAPVQMSGRVMLEDAEIAGQPLARGEKVYLHVGAANRDAAAFADPQAFELARERPALAFGWGATRCVGSEFASACAADYLRALLTRFGRVDRAATEFDHGLSARGLKSAIFTFDGSPDEQSRDEPDSARLCGVHG